MDIHMPEMDGIGAVRQIRRIEAVPDNRVPIIALTASITQREKWIYLKEDMDAVVGKPIDFHRLFEIMEQLVPENKGKKTANSRQEIENGEKNTKEMGSVYGVDIRKGLKVWQDAEIYKKALINFCRDYETLADKISHLLKHGDREGAARICHAIKGVAGNLSVTAVYDIAVKLDAGIKKRKLDDLIPMMDALSEAMKRVAVSVRQLERKTETQKTLKKPMDYNKLDLLFRKMLNAFEEYDPSAIEPFIKELNESFSFDDVNPIEKKLERFDLKGAREETLRLAQKVNIEID